MSEHLFLSQDTLLFLSSYLDSLSCFSSCSRPNTGWMRGCVGFLSQRGEIHLNHPFRWSCPCRQCWGWVQSKGRGQSGWPPPSWTSTLPSCLSGVLGMGQGLASCSFSQELPRTWWERWLLTTLGLASASFMKMPTVPTAKCLRYTLFIVMCFPEGPCTPGWWGWGLGLSVQGNHRVGKICTAHTFPHPQLGPCVGSYRETSERETVSLASSFPLDTSPNLEKSWRQRSSEERETDHKWPQILRFYWEIKVMSSLTCFLIPEVFGT